MSMYVYARQFFISLYIFLYLIIHYNIVLYIILPIYNYSTVRLQTITINILFIILF